MSQKERLNNPLFVEDCSTAFDMPNLVVIADEDARKGVEVCDGAIGWLNTCRIPGGVWEKNLSFQEAEIVGKANLPDEPLGPRSQSS